ENMDTTAVHVGNNPRIVDCDEPIRSIEIAVFVDRALNLHSQQFAQARVQQFEVAVRREYVASVIARLPQQIDQQRALLDRRSLPLLKCSEGTAVYTAAIDRVLCDLPAFAICHGISEVDFVYDV